MHGCHALVVNVEGWLQDVYIDRLCDVMRHASQDAADSKQSAVRDLKGALIGLQGRPCRCQVMPPPGHNLQLRSCVIT